MWYWLRLAFSSLQGWWFSDLVILGFWPRVELGSVVLSLFPSLSISVCTSLNIRFPGRTLLKAQRSIWHAPSNLHLNLHLNLHPQSWSCLANIDRSLIAALLAGSEYLPFQSRITHLKYISPLPRSTRSTFLGVAVTAGAGFPIGWNSFCNHRKPT